MSLNRIAFVGNTSFSLYKFRLGVMRSLVERGYEVYAIAPVDNYSDFSEKERIKYIPITMDGQGKNALKDIKLIYLLTCIYKNHKFDFIFHYTIKPIIYGSIACCFNKIPCISIVTGLGYAFEAKNILNKLVAVLYRISQKSTLEVWFLNKDDKQTFLSSKIVYEAKTFILNGEGIDTTYYSPKVRVMESEKVIFLLLSCLIEDKGIREYVEAARILRGREVNAEKRLKLGMRQAL